MPCAGRRNGGRGGGSTAAQEFPARRVARSGGLALRGHGVGEGRRPAEEQRIAGPVAVIGRGGCRNHQQARCTVHARCDGGSQRVPDGRGLASRKANGCDLYLCLCKRQRQQSNTSSRYRLPGTQHGGIIKHCAAPDLPFGRPFTAFCPLPPAPPPCNHLSSPLPANMCLKVVHKYGCGHEQVATAPCATSKTSACGVNNVKTVKHEEKCETCDH
jgi:hypothetical protein